MIPTLKKRYNISLDDSLHDWAAQYAKEHGTDFSGYLTQLLSNARDEKKESAVDLEQLARLLHEKQRERRRR